MDSSTVSHALQAMYSPQTDQAQKKEAALFLEQFQKNPEAWQLALEFLGDPATPLEYRMFAAQTLRLKATYDLQQLPEASFPQIRQSMLALLKTYAPKEKLIRVQLSLAVCQMALQDLHWHSAMNDISGALSAPEAVPALLEFLKSLPEELTDSNKTPLTDDEFSARTRELITQNVPTVLLLLSQMALGGPPHTELILACLNSWIKECAIEDVLRVDALATLIFKSLEEDDTFDTAAECLCLILRETRDIENHQLIDALYHKLLEVHEAYEKSGKLDDDIARGLTRVYVEAGESWHVLMAKNPAHFKPLVRILLLCCKLEDLDVVKYTFYFWYQLKQMITLPRLEAARAEFQDIYLELVAVVIGHLQYPLVENEEDLFDGDREQEDKFREFRYEMGDVLKDCCAVLGPQKALNVPFQQIQTLLGQNSAWQRLEAPLFGMRVMGKEVSVKEKKILPAIMHMLIQLPEHPKIRYAATLVLGRYAEWTAKNPEFLEPQLNYIIRGFDAALDKAIVNATSQTLMYFCQDCAPLLVNYMDQLYMLYTRVCSEVPVANTFDLVDGLAHVINKLPLEGQYQACETFLAPTLQKISELAGGSGDETAQKLADEAEVLSIFLRVSRCDDYSLPEFPIARFFLEKIWPLVASVLTKCGQVLKVSETYCKVVKNAIRSTTGYLSPILESIAQQLERGFRETFYGCYLWVTGTLIQSCEEYGESANDVIYTLALLQSSTLLEMFQNPALDIRGIPDVIEDFFNMASDLLMFYAGQVVCNTQLVASLFETGILALATSEEYNPLMACVHFFIDYVSWGGEYPPVSFFEGNHDEIRDHVRRSMAGSHVDRLVEAVIRGLIYKFYNDVDANDLMIKILAVSPTAVTALQEAVLRLPNVSEKEVSKLVGVVTVAVGNKDNRRVRMAIKDFVSWYTRKNVNARAIA